MRASRALRAPADGARTPARGAPTHREAVASRGVCSYAPRAPVTVHWLPCSFTQRLRASVPTWLKCSRVTLSSSRPSRLSRLWKPCSSCFVPVVLGGDFPRRSMSSGGTQGILRPSRAGPRLGGAATGPLESGCCSPSPWEHHRAVSLEVWMEPGTRCGGSSPMGPSLGGARVGSLSISVLGRCRWPCRHHGNVRAAAKA